MNPIMNCPANYVCTCNPTPTSANPFFHADFERKTIMKLLFEQPARPPAIFPRVAGLCFVAADNAAGEEILYAFRVEFDTTGRNLVKDPNLAVDVVVTAKLKEVSDDPSKISVVETAIRYWREPEAIPFIPSKRPLQFVFVDLFTLLSLLIRDTSWMELRIRKTLFYSKQIITQ